MSTNSYLENLKKEMANYAKNNKSQKLSGKSKEEILAKYFVPRNPKEIFRILPPKPGKKHIQEAFFHVVSLNGRGGTKLHGKVLYCPAHNDPKEPKLDENGKPILDKNGKPVMVHVRCPLCEKGKKILSKQDPSLKGVKKDDMNQEQLKIFENNRKIFAESNKWQAKKFYIVRGIDKGKMKDGVKFWRFKHNFKNQGTMDKLTPILAEYIDVHGADFADPAKGADFTISMAESEFNGKKYMAISAISARQPSKLHEDPIIAQQWLDDDINWRDVFKSRKAPNISSVEYLDMVAEGNDPYWDDLDQNNKKWVFPGRPDLEVLANDRSRNLDADNEDEEIEQASDIRENDGVNVNNVTSQNVGTYTDDAVDVGGELKNSSRKDVQSTPPIDNNRNDVSESDEDNGTDSDSYDEDNDYDDLPF